MVLVDGRPTQLGANDLANLLRNMQSSQLDQIEIMTNPPAKYDAAGNAGIINIKTKRNKQVGYSGSVNVGVGHGLHARFNEGFNLAYRHNKVNLFGNFSHNYREQTQDLRIQRNFLHQDTKEVLYRFEGQSDLYNRSQSINGKVGFDYFADKKTTIGAVLTGFSGPGRFISNTVTNRLVSGTLTDQTKGYSLNENTFKNFGTNVNFRRLLDTTGKELTADLDYVVYDGLRNTRLENRYLDAYGAPISKEDTLYGRLPQTIKIYGAKIDYTQPMKNGARFEAGLKTSIVRTDNDAVYDTLNLGARQRDLGRSNHFVYEENINAAYLNLSTPLSKKLSAQLGLRLEHTNANGHSMGHRYDGSTGTFKVFDTTFNNNYAELFPTAYLQYKANEKNTFVLNYGRRIRRPNYESLNPFIEFIDKYTFQQGNPDLKPQFSHNIELSHNFRGFLNTTLNYTSTNNIIQQVVEQNEAKSETFIKQANIASQRQYGASVSVGMPLNKWWTANLYVNVFHNQFEGLVNNTRVSIGNTALSLNGSQQFKLGKTTSAEINGWYRTTAVEGVMLIQPVGMLSVGFSQQVLKGQGTIRLGVRDVFSTQHFKGKIKYGVVDAAFQNFNDSRAVNIGFTYRFSKGKVNGTQRKRSSSSADEQSRVGGGGN
jgi:hypothetical protein